MEITNKVIILLKNVGLIFVIIYFFGLVMIYFESFCLNRIAKSSKIFWYSLTIFVYYTYVTISDDKLNISQ